MPIGEVFLGAFISVLLNRLATPEVLNLARPEGLSEKLKKWKKTLSVIKTVLDDAEEKQHEDGAVKNWLDDLRDWAFDLEDIVDEFDTEALRRKLVGENQASSSTETWNRIPALFTRWNPSSSSLRSKLEGITERFDNILAHKDLLNLKGKVDGSSNRRRSRPEPSTSLVNEAGVLGREADVEAVLKLLPNEVHKPAKLTVIPIRGMGGVGKTTLAQLLYNDERVEKFFELKAWACVSEDFDVVKVTKTILESHSSQNCDGKDLNWLQQNLQKTLQGKRFLVILDDLWNEKYDEWFALRVPFEAGAPGSTIIVTTRNKDVSSMVGTKKTHKLLPLSNKSCLSILTLHALGRRDFNSHPHLETVGENIARKCKDLPLAAKTLGGLLRTTRDSDDWEEVLASKLWTILEKPSRNIVPGLLLSYHHLPPELKRCFAYCSIFPKDYEFEEEKLVLLWMAEGLIQPREKEKQMEDVGREYFHILVSRSFFQLSTKNKSWYLMHDLINDLAQYVAADTCFKMEDRIYSSKEGNIPRKARHSSYLGGLYDGAKKFEALSHCTCLRTFLPLMFRNLGRSYLTCDVPLQLLPKLRCLRVLSLRGYCIKKISDSIGELKQLRYLDLSYTAITSMPESTTTLYNLQTLLLEKCRELVKLPSTFANLVNLRHFNVLGADSLEGLPPQIGKLTFLRTLSNLVVGKESCSGIKELKSLSNLRGTLRISGLENVIDPRDAWEANLSGKCNLSGLVLEWSDENGEPQDMRRDLEVLDMLQPHKSLKELTLRNYGGTEFPTWLWRASFPNMVLLRIENCKWCSSLPPIGHLSSLKYLFIKGMARVKIIGTEFYGEGCSTPFKSLRTLNFENMEEWENWSPCEEFPRLRVLSIKSCPMMSGELPNQLPLLERIEVTDCARLVVSISRLPALSKITISGCKDLVCRNNDGFRRLLRSADLYDISKSASQIEGLIDVEHLSISNCEELMPLWSNKEGFLQHFPCLRKLYIKRCDKLVSLVANETCLPSTLRQIMIYYCSVLEHLPKAMMYNNMCLEFIYIIGCHSLRNFARGQLPPTLRRLHIEQCENIWMVLVEESTKSCSSRSASLLLEELLIWHCPSLESLTSSRELPTTLKHLEIGNCQKLESIAKSLHRNSFLETIKVCWCENLKALPTGIHSLSGLHQISIFHCPNLVPFSDGGREFLPPNLRNFRIDIGISSFREDTLPSNLTSLQISHLEITEILLESGLHRLTSLKELIICGGCPYLVSFPTLEMMLPASLTSLSITSFPNLQNLSSESLRRLTSLKNLSIGKCEELTSFPEDGLPPSLLVLQIDECRKLTTFPKNGLPPSLLQLRVTGCPLLEANCDEDQGREWSKIAHIPYVGLKREFVYDP